MSRQLESITKSPVFLINTANRYDRFQLLDDPNLPAPNIDNDIHPLFHAGNFTNASSDTYRNLKYVLRLASLFIENDTVLEWFVAPLFGLPLLDTKSKKNYLSDPSTTKSRREREPLIQKVRDALDCLSHSITFRFVSSNVKYFARTTIIEDRCPPHGRMCSQHNKPEMGMLIEIRGQYLDFLQRLSTSCSLAERVRHDFSLAVTLLHEIAHAVGVMRRGHLREPFIRLDHPSAEFGYAWENFMFGGIINPFDRASTEIGFLMRKMWVDDPESSKGRVREWGSVPIAYIAQWFQRSTWEMISEQGPTAIPAPISHLKLRSYSGQRYILLSDNEHALEDVRTMQYDLIDRFNPRYPAHVVMLLETKLKLTTPETLQKHISAQPVRITKFAPRKSSFSVTTKPVRVCSDSKMRTGSKLPPTAASSKPELVSSLKLPLKRPADNDRESIAETFQGPHKKLRID